MHQLILQISHCDEAVRSAVIALGSIGERLSINNFLTLENEKANACHKFAHFQYYKALKKLRERISNDFGASANLAIILCFLFTIFEFLQGNDAGSLIHLRSGLNILRQDHGSLSTGLRAVTSDPDPLRREILKTFSIMDLQATRWLGLQSFQAPMITMIDGPVGVPVPLDPFSTLEEASESLQYLSASTYHLRRLAAASDTAESPIQIPLEVLTKREELITQSKRWPILFEELTKKRRGQIDTKMSLRIVVLKMNYETILLELTACLQPSSQQVYADHESKFRHIVDLAKSVIGPMEDPVKLGVEHIIAANNTDIHPTPMFSFYTGFIRPLYLTAINCQNLSVCREAIALLSSSPWREGAWDSATMARIASHKVQDVEKKHRYGSADDGFALPSRTLARSTANNVPIVELSNERIFLPSAVSVASVCSKSTTRIDNSVDYLPIPCIDTARMDILSEEDWIASMKQ